MDKSKKRLKADLEYEPGPDSEQWLLQAFEMLFKGIAIDPEVLESKEPPL